MENALGACFKHDDKRFWVLEMEVKSNRIRLLLQSKQLFIMVLFILSKTDAIQTIQNIALYLKEKVSSSH